MNNCQFCHRNDIFQRSRRKGSGRFRIFFHEGDDMKKIVRFACLSLAAFFLFATPLVASADWVEYLRRGRNRFSYHSKLNVDKTNGKYIVRCWEKKTFPTRKGKTLQSLKEKGLPAAEYEQMSRKMFTCDIDCGKNLIRKASLIVYDTSGKVIFSGKTSSPQWEPILPDSTEDALRKAVCK